MLLTIITITFNDVAGLRKTSDSIVSQSVPPRWIVVDGGTKDDGVLTVLESSAVERAFREPDMGIYDAMRKGLLAARTDFVLFLNSGDTFASTGAIATILGNLDDADVLYFGANFMVGSSVVYSRMPRVPSRVIWHTVPGNQQATVYRREKLVLLWSFDRYKICGDYAIACNFFVANSRTKLVDSVISEFALGGVSTSSVITLAYEAWVIQRDILRQNFAVCVLSLAVRLLSASRTYVLYRCARMCKRT